jgi:hypothetical protein
MMYSGGSQTVLGEHLCSAKYTVVFRQWTRGMAIFSKSPPSISQKIKLIDNTLGVEGVVRGLEGIHLADTCILTRLE